MSKIYIVKTGVKLATPPGEQQRAYYDQFGPFTTKEQAEECALNLSKREDVMFANVKEM